jgi:hypothetical protein
VGAAAGLWRFAPSCDRRRVPAFSSTAIAALRPVSAIPGPRGSQLWLCFLLRHRGTPRRVGPGVAPVFPPHGRYLAYADRFDSSLAPRALHIADLWKPSLRVTLPGVLATTGFLDQLTWLP